jgi:hypothetical protein
MFSKEDHLEAAKLAKMISSQLSDIDSRTTDPASRRANNININRFVSNVVNPNGNQQPIASGYLPEAMVQKMIPDVSQIAPNNDIAPLPIENVIQSMPQLHNTSSNTKQNNNSQQHKINVDDKSFRRLVGAVERIAKSYEKYVEFLTKTSTLDNNPKVLNE